MTSNLKILNKEELDDWFWYCNQRGIGTWAIKDPETGINIAWENQLGDKFEVCYGEQGE